MAGDGGRHPAGPVGHSNTDEAIHERIRFCVPSTHAWHKVFLCLFTLYPGTCWLPEPWPNNLHPAHMWARTKYGQDIWKQHHQQHSVSLTNTSKQSRVCVFEIVWHWATGVGSRYPCSSRGRWPISVAVKDLYSDKETTTTSLSCLVFFFFFFSGLKRCYGLWDVPRHIFSVMPLWKTLNPGQYFESFLCIYIFEGGTELELLLYSYPEQCTIRLNS